MHHLVLALKALSDESRLRILNLLIHAGEICVCDIERVLGFTQTKVSRHLTALKNARLVDDRRQGLWILYSIAPNLDESSDGLLRELTRLFSREPVFQDDILRLHHAVKNGSCTTFGVIYPKRLPLSMRTKKQQANRRVAEP